MQLEWPWLGEVQSRHAVHQDFHSHLLPAGVYSPPALLPRPLPWAHRPPGCGGQRGEHYLQVRHVLDLLWFTFTTELQTNCVLWIKVRWPHREVVHILSNLSHYFLLCKILSTIFGIKILRNEHLNSWENSAPSVVTLCCTGGCI